MKVVFTMFLILMSGIGLKAQNKSKKVVNQVVVDFFDGLAELKEEKLKVNTTKDFLLLEDGMVWTVDSLTKGFDGMRKASIKRVNSFQFIKTDIKGNTAWVSYYNKATITRGDNNRVIEWLESAVLIREGKDWKINLMHSTPLKKKSVK
ncbi:MAG: nuclear transport factor 2 family protein [Pedobacter sp.]|nr:MAG: nuclear transport factor 2 family protein [Pedobacter sp.]